MKILMIEDNKSVSEMMQMFFKKKKAGTLTLRMMVSRRFSCLMKVRMSGI